ncbi:unnamed protein product [Jaminaea pallidilutea]
MDSQMSQLEKDDKLASEELELDQKARKAAVTDEKYEEPQRDAAVTVNSDVFAAGDGTVEFRGVHWFGAACLIAKSQFGLGVLGIPFTFMTLGFFPGMLSLVILSVITTWTGLVVGNFRNRHPSIHSIGDAAYVLFGVWGREVMGATFWLLYTFCYGAAALTVSKAFNTFSDHSLCTVGFVGIAAILSLLLGSLTRTLKTMSWCSYVALASVFLGVWVTAIACLTQDRPAAAPPAPAPVMKNITAFAATSFGPAMAAVSTQLFSLGGTASFFSIHAEMENPHHYRRSLLAGQGFVVLNYIVVSAIMYGKVGSYITSPALGSAGERIKVVAYGISFPALLFSCFFQAHLAAKYTFVRLLRNTKHLQHNTTVHWTVWLASLILSLVVGFAVAGAIPFFGDLLGLIGAFLMPSFTIIVPACLALYSSVEDDERLQADVQAIARGNWLLKSWSAAKARGKRSTTVVIAAYVSIVLGLFIFVAGTYGSIVTIIDSYATGSIGSAFSCADNA